MATALIVAVFTAGIAFGIMNVIRGEKPETGQIVDGMVQFNITESQWSFSPAAIEVNPGDKVRFIITSQDMMHGFTVNELGINLGISPNQTITKEVTVPSDIKEGIYPVYCSVYCGIGHPYMKARIVVGNPALFLGIGWNGLFPYSVTFAAVLVFFAVYYWWRRSTPHDAMPGLDLTRFSPVKRLVNLHSLQFLAILPVLALFVIATISILYGVRMASMNFGMVLTWVVWWGTLIGLFIIVGRGWCFLCPFGSIGEWLQRASLWWKSKWSLGFDFKYPRKLQNLWPAIGVFIVFLFLDAGYGISNNLALTGSLIVVLILWAAWMGILFERRTFCRYQCPLTVFAGMSAMFSPLEIRRNDAGVCEQCRTKDCFRGNDRFYGCPTFQFQGAGLDSNRDCILCTECIKACPQENVGMRLRWWSQDLWARKKGRADEAVAAVIIAGLVTVVPLLLVLLLPRLRENMSRFLPAGNLPNDWPRLAGIGIIYLGGIGLALLLAYGFSRLSRRFSGRKDASSRAFFIHFAYALIPLGVMKFFADILDHVLRNWGYLVDATRGLIQDFPRNRTMLPETGLRQLMSAEQIYFLQAALIGIGFIFSLCVAFKLAERMFPEKATAFRAFLPIGGFIFILTMAAVWVLSTSL